MFFHFRFLFQFLSMLFLFIICFSFFMLYSFIFLLLKKIFLFHFVSLFSFLGCSKSVAAHQDSLGRSAHSELALFALCWLVVTFPCGIVHILVMIRLRVLFGGRRVGQVPPSHQNRQISALDKTADAPQSSLFSSLFISVLLIILSSTQSCPSPSPRSPLVSGYPFSQGNGTHSEKVWSSPREKGTRLVLSVTVWESGSLGLVATTWAREVREVVFHTTRWTQR